jgi:hypothetical protein
MALLGKSLGLIENASDVRVHGDPIGGTTRFVDLPKFQT